MAITDYTASDMLRALMNWGKSAPTNAGEYVQQNWPQGAQAGGLIWPETMGTPYPFQAPPGGRPMSWQEEPMSGNIPHYMLQHYGTMPALDFRNNKPKDKE